MEICPICHLAHPVDTGNMGCCVIAQAAQMKALLKNIGDPGNCRGCQAEIYWVTHKNGKKTPYTPAGLNHHVDCVAAKQFDRKNA